MGHLVLLGLLLPLQGMGAWAQACGYRPAYDRLHSSPESDARIVGGWRAHPAKWPWVVSVQTSTYHFCGGSIVHPWWVLSAAHCFTDRRNEYIKVAAGSNFLGRSNVTRWVQKVFMHPQYSTKTYDNDIALLLLQAPVPYSWYHSAVCLPDDSIVPDDNLWENCFVAGWGLTRAGGKQGSSALLEVQVEIVDWQRCWRWLRALTKNMVCAGYEEGGRDACQGDSGGPLMCRPSSSGRHARWYEVGVVSWGRGCAGPQKPGVYARVANYHSWIEETARQAGRPFRVPQQPASQPVPPGGEQQEQPHQEQQEQQQQQQWDEAMGSEESVGMGAAPLQAWTATALAPSLALTWLLR